MFERQVAIHQGGVPGNGDNLREQFPSWNRYLALLGGLFCLLVAFPLQGEEPARPSLIVHDDGAPPSRDWTVRETPVVDARPLLVGQNRIVLWKPDHSTVSTRRTYLSQADRDYLKALDREIASRRLPSLDFYLVRWAPQQYAVKYECEIRSSKRVLSSWIGYTGHPPTTPWQKVLDFNVSPQGQKLVEDGSLEREVWRLRSSKSNTLRISTDGVVEIRGTNLYRRRPDEFVFPVPDATTEQLSPWLRTAEHTQHDDSEFAAWLKEQQFLRKSEESEIEFADRVVKHFIETYTYHYQREMPRRADDVIDETRADCGGLVNLFVAILRANRIPARGVVGRWAKPDTAPNPSGSPAQAHIVAEFYADKIGWIPVDTVQSLGRPPKRSGYPNFGTLHGFVALHLDTDFQLDSIHQGPKSVPYLQTPVFWSKFAGNPTFRIEEAWSVQRVRTEKPRAD